MSTAPTSWRVGQHYDVHVYDDQRPVATFHRPEDAHLAVAAVSAFETAVETRVVERYAELLGDLRARDALNAVATHVVEMHEQTIAEQRQQIAELERRLQQATT